jgi:chitin disaccharide deacetylase
MKSLIVNADDFGASHGINHGVVEAHRRGILTSASMMVDQPASEEAAHLSLRYPDLGVGLHVVIRSVLDSSAAEVERQLERFVELTGQLPTHIDAHHNAHEDERVLPAFLGVAQQHSLPLRGHCDVRHIPTFYGQWDGMTHLESISPEALARVVAAEAEDGYNELCCHPGYADGDLVSSYTRERQTELETLCDGQVAAVLRQRGIRLVSFREVQAS